MKFAILLKRSYWICLVFIIGQSSMAAIYGADQRRDISQTHPRWHDAASAVAVALPSFYLKDLDEDHYFHSEHDQRSYWDEVGICKDEKFASQKTFGHCSAFLIHPKLLVTAGHCFVAAGKVEDIKHSYCEHFSFWLGYNDIESPIPSLGSIIAKKNVVHCKKVIYAENNEEWDPKKNPIDFAVIELEEEVAHIKPLTVTLDEVPFGKNLVTIGHPHGLPAKHSGHSALVGNYETTLTSFMDTLSGNSGGPTFNELGEVVGVLIAGHPVDTVYDPVAKCDRVNRCTTNGKNCDDGTELENSNLIIKSKLWQPYVNDYLKKFQTIEHSI